MAGAPRGITLKAHEKSTRAMGRGNGMSETGHAVDQHPGPDTDFQTAIKFHGGSGCGVEPWTDPGMPDAIKGLVTDEVWGHVVEEVKKKAAEFYSDGQLSYGMCPLFCVGIVMNCHNDAVQKSFKEVCKEVSKYKLKPFAVSIEYIHWVMDRGRDNSPPSQDYLVIRHPAKKGK